MDGVPGRAGTKQRPKEERVAGFQAWSKTQLRVMITQLDNLLGDNQWFLGNGMRCFSWADVAVFNRLENLNGIAAVYGVEVLDSPLCTKMKRHSERVAAVPGIKAYLDARMQLMMKQGTAGKSSGTYGGPGHFKIINSGTSADPVVKILPQ
jgi:hypothetical protein